MAKILKLAALVGLGYAGYNALSPTDKTAATKALGFKSTPTNETDFIELIKQTIKGDRDLQRLLTGPTGAIGPVGATGATGATGANGTTLNNVSKEGSTLFNNPQNSTDSVNYTTVFSNGKKSQIQQVPNGGGTDFYFFDGTSWLNALAIRPDGGVFKIGGGTFSALSDQRVKTNITDFTSGLEKVLAIETKTFNYKKVKGTQTEFYPDFLIQKKQYGVIAQQLQTVCPEMVTEGEDGFLTVDLSNLSLLLVNAVKELNKKDTDQQKLITSQAAKIKALEDQQALILDRLTALEAK